MYILKKLTFTFYGGIYRDVELIVVNKVHFDMDHLGGPGLRITPTISSTSSMGIDTTLEISNVNLWDGLESPYLYTAHL